MDNIDSYIVYPIFFGLAVIMFTYAGILYLTSAGNPGNLGKAKEAVIWGVVGAIIGVAAGGIISLIKTIVGA
jgi:hypothetical protein